MAAYVSTKMVKYLNKDLKPKPKTAKAPKLKPLKPQKSTHHRYSR